MRARLTCEALACCDEDRATFPTFCQGWVAEFQGCKWVLALASYAQEIEASPNPSGISYDQFQKLVASLELDKAKGSFASSLAQVLCRSFGRRRPSAASHQA